MEYNKLVYLGLLAASLAYPMAQSFERRLKLYRTWRFFSPGSLITAAIFLAWDIYFAYAGVWGFNPEYVTGLFFFKLPVEEWLFFIIIPYCCYFLYAVLNYFIPKTFANPLMKPLHWFFVLLLIIGAIWNIDRTYTVVAFLVAAIVLGVTGALPFYKSLLYRFYSTFFLSVIPFLIVNGFLTSLPVVTYNDAENLGLRIINIPVEDFIYLLSLLFMNLGFYEWRRREKSS